MREEKSLGQDFTFNVRNIVFKDSINNDENFMSNGNSGSLATAPGGNRTIHVIEKRLIRFSSGKSTLNQNSFNKFIAFSEAGVFLLPALSFEQGTRPAQEQRWAAEGNCAILKPISAAIL